MSEEMKDTSNVMDTAATAQSTAEEVALMEFTDQQVCEYEEGKLSGKEKAKFLLLTPLTNTIIKFCLIGLGLVSLVLLLVGMLVPNALNGLYQIYSGIACAVSGILPFSVFELAIILTIVGWLAYLIFVLVRFIQVFKNGKLLAGRMWIQFLYSTIALVLVYTMLFSFGYGIIGSRTAFHKASAYADGTQMYNNVSATEGELSETLVYLIDKLNTVVVNDAPNQNIVFLAKNGASQYNIKGNANLILAKEVSTAFQNAAKDIPALKGPKINAKELLAGPLFTAMGVGSMYSPLTSEVLVNPYYPEVCTPMLVAKAIAKQRGFHNDAQADMIAYLVCTRYTNNPYVQYSAYFNAYLATGSKLAKRNPNTYATVASALKESVKKEVIYYTRKLDSLYGNKSSLQFTENGNLSSAEKYLEYPELMINYYRQRLVQYTDPTAELNCGYYVNSLIDLYRQDVDYQTEINNVVAKYSEYQTQTNQEEVTKEGSAEDVPAEGTEGTTEETTAQ